MGETLHPSVEWAQRAHLVFITVNVTDCENPEIKVKKDTLYFKGRGGPDNKLFETKLNLFGEIKKDSVKYTVRPRCIEFALEKVEKGHFWSRLLAEKNKQHWLKPDFSKWKDKDEYTYKDTQTYLGLNLALQESPQTAAASAHSQQQPIEQTLHPPLQPQVQQHRAPPLWTQKRFEEIELAAPAPPADFDLEETDLGDEVEGIEPEKEKELAGGMSECTDDDKCTDEEVCTDEDEWTDEDKSMGDPTREAFEEQVLAKFEGMEDSLLRGEWSDNPIIEHFLLKDLEKIKADLDRERDECTDVPRPEGMAVQELGKLQPSGDTLEKEKGDGQASGAFFGNRGIRNQPALLCKKVRRIYQVRKPKTSRFKTRQGEGVQDLEDKMRNMGGLGSGMPDLYTINHSNNQVLHLSGGPKNENNTSALKQIPNDKLENFYKHQYYNLEVQKTKLEWDSLVILPQCKTVINIEVKLGNKHFGNKLDLLEHAAKQTEKHNDYFQKVFGPTLSEGWKFVRAACVPYLTVSENYYKPCSNCKQYILRKKDVFDLYPMFNMILNNFNSVNKKEFKVEYNTIISRIIGYSSLKSCDKLQKLIVDPIDYSKQTERALTGKNPGISGENEVQRYMLTPTQLNAIHFNNPIMVLHGDFGTGKTYVLKEKAKLCAEKYRNRKIVFFNLTATDPELKIPAFFGYSIPTVMDLIAEQYFEKYPNVRVICCKELFEYLPDHEKKRKLTAADILLFVKHHNLDKFDHIFIDELHDANYSRSDLSKLLKLCRTICITLKFNCDRMDGLRKWFQIVDDFKYKAALVNLTINMRNSENVVEMAKACPVDPSRTTFLMPKKTVPGNANYYYQNDYYLSDCSLIVAALNKYFSRDPLESVVVLLCDDLDAKVAYNELIKHFPPERKIVCLHPSEPMMKVKEYLKKPEGIFITNIRNFQGAQARNVIVTARTCEPFITGDIRNLVLRTMSFGIYIGNRKDFREAPGICLDTDLHDFINKEKPPVECFHYRNIFGLGIDCLTYAILDKYFPCGLNETVVVFTNQKYPFDNSLQERRRDVTIHQHFDCAIENVDPSNLKPGNVFLIHLEKRESLTYKLEDDWYSSPLVSTDNIIVFINNTLDTMDAMNYRNRIIRARPKRAIVIHKDADFDMIFPPLKSIKITRITDLLKHI